MDNLENKIEKLQHKIDIQHKIYRFVLFTAIAFISLLLVYVTANLLGFIQ